MMFLRSLLIASVADAQKCVVKDPANTAHSTANCTSGTGINGDIVDDGTICTAQCASNTASPAKLECKSGSIGVFDCVDTATTCVVATPKGPSEAQASSPCTSGTNSLSDTNKCTLQCATGYEIAEVDYQVADALQCKVANGAAGLFVKGSDNYTGSATTTDGNGVETGNYSCGPASCEIAAGAFPASNGLVVSASNIVCTYNDGTTDHNKVETDKILDGQECVSVCAAGNEPTLKSRKCNKGVWSPTFAQVDKHKCQATAADDCLVPTLEMTGTSSNAGLSCTEAAQATGSGQNLVANGNNCTANCPTGFTANSDLKLDSAAVACNNSNVADFAFVCRAKSCDAAGGNVTIAGGGSTDTQFCKVDGTAADTVPSGKRCMPNCASGETGYIPAPGTNDGILCLEGLFRKADGTEWAAVTSGNDVYTAGPTIECVADASCRVPDPPAYHFLEDDSNSKKVTVNCSNVSREDMNTTGNQISGTVAQATYEANVCVAQCATGYKPSVPKLTCNTVSNASPTLSPMNFVCTPKGCVVPAPSDNAPTNRIYSQVGSIKTNYLQNNDEAELLCDSGSPVDLYDATTSNGVTAFSSSNKIKCVLGQLKYGTNYADDFLGWTCLADTTNDCLVKRVAANAQYYATNSCSSGKDAVANAATCDLQCGDTGMVAAAGPTTTMTCTSGSLEDTSNAALTNNIFTCVAHECTMPTPTQGTGVASSAVCVISNGSRAGTDVAAGAALKGGEYCEAQCSDFGSTQPTISYYHCGKTSAGHGVLEPQTTSHTCEGESTHCAISPPTPLAGGPAIPNPCDANTSATDHVVANTDVCVLQCASGFTAARVESASPTNFDVAPDAPSGNALEITCGGPGRYIYTCTAAQCTLSAAEVPDANGGNGGNYCAGSNTVDHGSDCTTQCAANYRPNVAKLSCSKGVFTPIGFWCIANPTGANNAGGGCEILPLSPTANIALDSGNKYQVSCSGNTTASEESVLSSGTTGGAVCNTPACATSFSPKYWNGTAVADPDNTTHVCTDGALSAARFSCVASTDCLAGGIPNAKEIMCISEGESTNSVATTKHCLVQCKDGFYPNIDQMLCNSGTWEPPSYGGAEPYEGTNGAGYFPTGSAITTLANVACIARDCSVPDPASFKYHDGNNCASSADVGGGNPVATATSKIGHMKECVPQCLVGYEPEVSVLKCDRGILTPPTFTCRESGCSLSPPSTGAHTGGPCSNVSADNLMAFANGVQKLRSGEKCSLQCSSDATLEAESNTEITCTRGALKPISSFTCQTSDCKIVAPSSNTITNMVCKNKQAYGTNNSVIQEAGECTPACAEGYMSMPEMLLCHEPGVVVDADLGTLLVDTQAQYTCSEMGCMIEDPLSGNGTDDGHCKKVYDSSDTIIAGKTGSKLAHGEKCEMMCADTYTAKPLKLKCALGKLVDGGSGGDPFMGRFECVGASECFVANPATGGIADGMNCTNSNIKNVFATGTCDAGCGVGYVPNGATGGATTIPVTCNSGTPQTNSTDLTNNTYTCDEKSCDLGTVESGATQLCSETRDIGAGSADGSVALTGSVLPSGKQCTTACATAHTSTSTTVKCSKGVLTPSKFECAPDTGCIVPSPTSDGFDYGNCTGSTTNALASSGTCTPRCKDDSFSASETTLTCASAGTLSPASFTCTPKKCSGTAPTTNGASTFCSNVGDGSAGNDVLPGHWCSTTCADGFEPSVAIVLCQGGATPAFVASDGSALTSQSYTCGAKSCRVSVAHYATNVTVTQPPCSSVLADGTGEEGFIVASGSKCTTQCEDGYVPKENQAELNCTNGVLKDTATTPADISSSNKFTCVAEKCIIPNPAANANSAGNCSAGGTTASGVTKTDSGATCVGQCATGYTADNGSDDTTAANRPNLTCTLGELSNSGKFECKQNATDCVIIYTGTGAADKACSESSGTNIRADTETCTLQCADGYEPNQVSRKCVAGLFKELDGTTAPAAFACTEKGCTIAAPKSGNGNATSLCTGVTKTGDATIIASEAECQTSCTTGYTPTVAKLDCESGVLTPTTFECVPTNGCLVNMPTEGNALDTGFFCKTIKMSDGTAASSSDSNVLSDGQICEPQCAPHATDSEQDQFPHNGNNQLESITCAAGSLTPATWSCKIIPDLSVADLAAKLEVQLVAFGIVLRTFADSVEVGTKLSEWENAATADVATKRDAFVDSLTGPTDAQMTELKTLLADNVTSALDAIIKVRADNASFADEVKTEFNNFVVAGGITPSGIADDEDVQAAWTAFKADANATGTEFINGLPDLTDEQVTAITAFIAKYPRDILIAGMDAWFDANETDTTDPDPQESDDTKDNKEDTTTSTTTTSTTSTSSGSAESSSTTLGVTSAFIMAAIATAFRA